MNETTSYWIAEGLGQGTVWLGFGIHHRWAAFYFPGSGLDAARVDRGGLAGRSIGDGR